MKKRFRSVLVFILCLAVIFGSPAVNAYADEVLTSSEGDGIEAVDVIDASEAEDGRTENVDAIDTIEEENGSIEAIHATDPIEPEEDGMEATGAIEMIEPEEDSIEADGTIEPEDIFQDTATDETEAAEDPLNAAPDGKAPGGKCGGEGDGSNLTWKITGEKGNYKLVISGSGQMKNGWPLGSGAEYPGNWGGYAESVVEVKLSDGVGSIGNYAFYGFKKLKKVTISKSVEKIGREAFKDCIALKKADIPGSVSIIDEQAFSGCVELSDLAIREGVKEIREFSFEHCDKLQWVYIPASVTKMYLAFPYCPLIPEIRVSSDNPKYEARNHSVITKDTKELIWGCHNTVIPDDVVCIYSLAFLGSTLTEISIPDNVTEIRAGAFVNCTNLTKFRFPGHISKLERDTFDGCTSLSEVTIEEGVTEIGEIAFEGCSSLKTIFIPGSVRKIDKSAFSHTGIFGVFYGGSSAEWDSLDIDPEKLDYMYQSNTDTICKQPRLNNAGEIDLEYHDGNKVSYIWSPEALLTNQKEIDKRETLSALALCRATYFGADEVDSTLMKLGLIDGKNDQSRWAYAYDDTGVAHTIAIKKQGDYNIITVAIRGTSWDDAHDFARVDLFPAGFAETAAHITDDLESFLYDRDVAWNDSRNRFFLTGHSMGAAVAGDIAKRIETHDGIDKSRITCYTFAAPYNVYDPADYQVNHNPWYYIHNFINVNDAVPFANQIGAFWMRWGTDYWLDPLAPEVKDWYRYLTGEEYNPINLMANHSVELYLAELLSTDAFDVQRNMKKRIAIVRCPVDVEVLDRYGRTFGGIVNNEAKDRMDERILFCMIGDDKYVILPADGEYELRLTGTDTGTMRYEISDYTSAGSGTEASCETKIFEDVALKAGKKMSSSIGGDFGADDVRLYVLNENGNVVKEVNEDGTEEDTMPGFGIRGIDAAGYTYTGSAIRPEVEVFYYENLLTAKKDYTVSFDKNVNVTDKAVITVNGKGNYKGKETETFKITAKDISASDVSVSGIASVAYNKKKNYKPVPTIVYNGKKLKNNKDFSIAYYPDEECLQDPVTPKAPGRYYARISGQRNFTGYRVISFEIASSEEVPVSSLTVMKIDDQPYRNGNKITPHPVVKKGGTVLVENTHYTLSWGTNTGIGTGTVTIKGIAPYVGEKTVSFKITGALMSRMTIEDIPESYVYDGTAKTPVPRVVNSEKGKSLAAWIRCATEEEYDAMTDDSQKRQVGCILSYSGNINVGKATVTMRGINGCSGTVKRTFRITPFVITEDPEDLFEISLEEDSYPYAKGGIRPKPVVSFKGSVLKEGKDYTLSYANNTSVNNAGGKKKPSVKVKGKGNFKGTAPAVIFRIEQADLAASGVKLTAKDIVYKNRSGNFKTKVSLTGPDGKALKAGKDYDSRKIRYTYDAAGEEAVSSDAKVPAGTTIYVTVNAKGSSYKGSLTGSYRIVVSDIGKLKASVADKTYTGKRVTLDPDEIIWKSGKKKVDGVTFEIDAGSYKNNIKKGKATVVVRGTGNYGGTSTVTFRIGARGFRWWWRDALELLP